MKPVLIIVSGLSCTGKTTLAQKLSTYFHLPYFSKDMFKELAFDRLGIKDRQWSQTIGRLAYDTLYLVTANLLAQGKSLIIESNFKSKYDRPRLLSIQKQTPFRAVEILCHANGDVLFDRFKTRALSGQRHPGHVDHLCLNEQQKILSAGLATPLRLGRLIKIDTTDFATLDYQKIIAQIEAKIYPKSPKMLSYLQ